MSQLKKAAFLSYLNIVITNVLGIFITPFFIRMVGNSDYGLFSLIGAFVGYLSVLDLGLNNAIVRFVSKYRTQQDPKGQENFLAISFLIYLAIGVIIFLFGTVMYFNLDALFGDTLISIEMIKARKMTLIVVFNIAITLPGGAFIGICNGYEKFVFPRVLSIIKYLTRSALVVSILYLGADSLDIVILDAVINFIVILITIYYVFFKLGVKIKLHKFESNFVKDIFSYSIWIFVFGLVYQFQWRTGQVIIGSTTNTVAVAIYSVGVTLGLYFMNFGNVINGLVLPKAVKSVYQNNDLNVLTSEMINISRITLLVLFYILGAFFLLGKEFIFLWVGDAYKKSWLIAILIMIAYLMPISQGYAHAILEAKKKMRFKSLLSLILTVLGLFIGGYLSQKHGVEGMILGVFGALILLQLLVLFYYHFKIGLNMKKYFSKALFPFLLMSVITSLITFFSIQFSGTGWGYFILRGAIYSSFFVAGFYFILNQSEKQYLFHFIKSKSNAN